MKETQFYSIHIYRLCIEGKTWLYAAVVSESGDEVLFESGRRLSRAASLSLAEDWLESIQ